MAERIVKVYGPAGTGKTTFIKQTIAQLQEQGFSLDEIGFFSFSRQALQAMAHKLGVEKLPPWFRTFHSLGALLHGIHGGNLMLPEDYQTLILQVKPNLGKQAPYIGELLESFLAYCGAVGKLPEDLLSDWGPRFVDWGVSHPDLIQLCDAFKAYKMAHSKMTYDDMLKLDSVELPRLPIVFFDEAQDLSYAQLKIADRLIDSARAAWIVGDPNQAIYGWGGADYVWLEQYPAHETFVLPKSYRLTPEVLEVSNNLLKRIDRVLPFHPREEQGAIEIVHRWSDLPLDNGESWLILARNRYLLGRIRNELRNRDILIQELGASNHHQDDYQRFLMMLAYEEIYQTKAVAHVKGVRRLTKDAVKLALAGVPVYEGLGMTVSEINRLQRVFAGPAKNDPIGIGTFHSSKGLEADNVAVMLECTKLQLSAYNRKAYDEICPLYVALTRARKNLYLLPSSGPNYPLRDLLEAPNA